MLSLMIREGGCVDLTTRSGVADVGLATIVVVRTFPRGCVLRVLGGVTPPRVGLASFEAELCSGGILRLFGESRSIAVVKLLEVSGHQAKLAFDADPSIEILRDDAARLPRQEADLLRARRQAAAEEQRQRKGAVA